MRDKSILIKTIQLIVIVLLYHISGSNSLFLYASTLSLYNIFLGCFSHITIKESLIKNNNYNSKMKVLKFVTINIMVFYLLFLLLSIFIGDALNIFLNIEKTFLPYLIMGISIITEPMIKILLEYLESYNKPKLSNSLLNMYYIIEFILLIIISVLVIKVIKLPIHISISLLYLSKIISFIILLVIIYLSFKKIKVDKVKKREELKINYKKEVKHILINNSYKSVIEVIKNVYIYVSIILLYMVLSSRYSYDLDMIEKDITFLYLYGMYIISFIVDMIIFLTRKKGSIINYIYQVFEKILIISIIIGVTSPLICKVIFLSSDNSIYLVMLGFLSIFMCLYNITYDYIKNTKVIYISLIVGMVLKLVFTIPLINSFYRMGYNLIYGDIISTMISMAMSVIINYIYIKLNNKNERTFEKILSSLYESILLCIVLVMLQFIIPIKTDSYIRTIFTLVFYIMVSIMCIKLRKKKRG